MVQFLTSVRTNASVVTLIFNQQNAYCSGQKENGHYSEFLMPTVCGKYIRAHLFTYGFRTVYSAQRSVFHLAKDSTL